MATPSNTLLKSVASWIVPKMTILSPDRFYQIYKVLLSFPRPWLVLPCAPQSSNNDEGSSCPAYMSGSHVCQQIPHGPCGSPVIPERKSVSSCLRVSYDGGFKSHDVATTCLCPQSQIRPTHSLCTETTFECAAASNPFAIKRGLQVTGAVTAGQWLWMTAWLCWLPSSL